MVTYLGSLVQLCCGEGGTLQTNIVACVGSARSVWTTLGLPQFKAVCASWVYTAQAPGYSAGHCPKQTLRFVDFPGLSCSGSGSQVFCKGTHNQLGMCSVPFPGPSSSDNQVFGKRTVPCRPCVLITSPVRQLGFPGCTARAQVCRVSPLGS